MRTPETSPSVERDPRITAAIQKGYLLPLDTADQLALTQDDERCEQAQHRAGVHDRVSRRVQFLMERKKTLEKRFWLDALISKKVRARVQRLLMKIDGQIMQSSVLRLDGNGWSGLTFALYPVACIGQERFLLSTIIPENFRRMYADERYISESDVLTLLGMMRMQHSVPVKSSSRTDAVSVSPGSDVSRAARQTRSRADSWSGWRWEDAANPAQDPYLYGAASYMMTGDSSGWHDGTNNADL